MTSHSLIQNPLLSISTRNSLLPTFPNFKVMKAISEAVRRNIELCLQNGLSRRQTAKRTGVSRSTVQRIAKQTQTTVCCTNTGRPPKLTQADKRFCKHLIVTHKAETAADVQKTLAADLGVSVS